MNRLRQMSWEVILVAPFVLALILAGVWLVVNAAYENYRLSQAADQILRTVAISRDMKIPKKASHQRIMEAFSQRMHARGVAQVITTKQSFLNQPAQKGFENPWGQFVTVYFYPKAQTVRLEALLSASACRRLLSLYADDAGDLGLRRVDVKNEEITSVWRQIYDIGIKKENAVIMEPAIHSGCGKEGEVTLSLSFNL